MKALKQFMRKNVHKLVYASIASSWIFGDLTSIFLFGEMKFPIQAYIEVKEKIM